VALVLSIIVTGANIALLSVMLRKLLKATSFPAMRENARVTAKEQEI